MVDTVVGVALTHRCDRHAPGRVDAIKKQSTTRPVPAWLSGVCCKTNTAETGTAATCTAAACTAEACIAEFASSCARRLQVSQPLCGPTWSHAKQLREMCTAQQQTDASTYAKTSPDAFQLRGDCDVGDVPCGIVPAAAAHGTVHKQSELSTS